MNVLRSLALPSDWKPLIVAAQEAQWTIEKTGGGHLRWRSPSGAFVFTASSPSDKRAMYNARSRLRRAGLPI